MQRIVERFFDPWQRDEAIAYVDALMAAMERAAAQPGLCTPREDLRPGVRMGRYKAHRFAFVVRDGVLVVLRVAHGRQRVEDMFR